MRKGRNCNSHAEDLHDCILNTSCKNIFGISHQYHSLYSDFLHTLPIQKFAFTFFFLPDSHWDCLVARLCSWKNHTETKGSQLEILGALHSCFVQHIFWSNYRMQSHFDPPHLYIKLDFHCSLMSGSFPGRTADSNEAYIYMRWNSL